MGEAFYMATTGWSAGFVEQWQPKSIKKCMLANLLCKRIKWGCGVNISYSALYFITCLTLVICISLLAPVRDKHLLVLFNSICGEEEVLFIRLVTSTPRCLCLTVMLPFYRFLVILTMPSQLSLQ